MKKQYLVYDLSTKSFSPAWNRKKYINIVEGYSDELCHNIYRLIMRPNSMSAKRWFAEAFSLLDDALGVKLKIKYRPVWMLFAFILDDNTKEFPIGINSDWLIRKVTREVVYGQVLNSDKSYIESKVVELYKSIDPTKVYTEKESVDLFYKWYLSINNPKRKFKLEH